MFSERYQQRLNQRMRGAGTHQVENPNWSIQIPAHLLAAARRSKSKTKSPTPQSTEPALPEQNRDDEASTEPSQDVATKPATPTQDADVRRRSSRLSGSAEKKRGAVATTTPVPRGKRMRQPSPERIASPEDDGEMSAKKRRVDPDTMREVLMGATEEDRGIEEKEEASAEQTQHEDVEVEQTQQEVQSGLQDMSMIEDTPTSRYAREVLSSSPSARIARRRSVLRAEQVGREEISQSRRDSMAVLEEEAREELIERVIDSFPNTQDNLDADTTVQEYEDTVDEPSPDESLAIGEEGEHEGEDDDTESLPPPKALAEIKDKNKVPTRQIRESPALSEEPTPAKPQAKKQQAPKKAPPARTTTAAQQKPIRTEKSKASARPRGEPIPVHLKILPGNKRAVTAADVLSTFISELSSMATKGKPKPEASAIQEYTNELQSRLVQIADLLALQAQQRAESSTLARERKAKMQELLGLRAQREKVRAEMEEVREKHEKAEKEDEEGRRIVETWEALEQLVERGKGMDVDGEVSGNLETELLLVSGSLGERERMADWKTWAEKLVKA